MDKNNVCQSCGNTGNSAIEGFFENKPFDKGVKQPNPYSNNQPAIINPNVPLNRQADTLFDANTGKFVTAQGMPELVTAQGMPGLVVTAQGMPGMGGPGGGGGGGGAPPKPEMRLKKTRLVPLRKVRPVDDRHMQYDRNVGVPEFTTTHDFKQMPMSEEDKLKQKKPLTDHKNDDDNEVEETWDFLCADD